MNRLPAWFRQEIPRDIGIIKKRLNSFKALKLNTVCASAHCPNISRCFQNNSVTFMILGNLCSRHCNFCAVDSGKPEVLDLLEGYKVGLAVRELNLSYIVITSVTRDDLSFGGATQFARTAYLLRRINPQIKIELLIPDFAGKISALKIVAKSPVEVIGHNLETVPRFYARARPQANYVRSLSVLKKIKKSGFTGWTKSGIMLGLGEERNEVLGVIADLRRFDCDILTLGQYLAPSGKHLPVREFVRPEEFEFYRQKALNLGFKAVYSGPLVRSSYNANEVYLKARKS